jgi:hypothetical protein
MAEHFIGMERLLEIRRLVTKADDPVDIVAELECEQTRDERVRETPPQHSGGSPTRGKRSHGNTRGSTSGKQPADREKKSKRSSKSQKGP